MLTSIQRGRGLAWFGLLVVVAEVVGASLTTHVDRRLHVMPLAPSHASYYPFLLVAVKVAAALALAALLARMTRLRATRDAGERLLAAAGQHSARRLPRLRTSLSPRAWLASFACTSVAYLVQMNTTRMANQRLPLFAPWLHTYALPMYAVLAVVVASRLGPPLLAARRRGARRRHAQPRSSPVPNGARPRVEPSAPPRRAPAPSPLRALARLAASSTDGLIAAVLDG